VKPFSGAFAGESPVRQSLTGSRERVLRGIWVTCTARPTVLRTLPAASSEAM